MSRPRESARMRRARRRRRILIIKMILILIVIILAVTGLILFLNRPRVAEEVEREAGSALPTVSDFLVKDNANAKIVSGLDDSVDMSVPGEYPVVIEISGKEYNSVLRVVDTTKPQVTTKNVTIFTTGTVEPEDLIESIEDVTATTVAFVGSPNLSQAGSYEVTIAVTDAGGNTTEATAQVEVVADTEPPVIEGVEDITIPAGTSVSYKRNVTVTDNLDEDVELTVVTDGVDLNTVGDYPITYIATDSAGNVTEVSAVLHVEQASVENATEDLVNAKADEILAQITTEDMDQKEVAEAIFWWVHENIGYKDGTPKTNWVQGAYRGLFERQGDCYVYFATSKCLLTQAGIKNMDIAKIPSRTNHYWNLIDLGEGWYHFDATRRKDGTYFFYTSDEELMEYSRNHNGSHNYDPSQYPEIQ